MDDLNKKELETIVENLKESVYKYTQPVFKIKRTDVVAMLRYLEFLNDIIPDSEAFYDAEYYPEDNETIIFHYNENDDGFDW